MVREGRSESYGREGGRKKPLRRRDDAGKREEEERGMAAGKKGPKDEKKTLKSGRNCRRRSSFNNALLRQKRGGNDSGGRRSPTFPLDSRHPNSDRRPTWRSPEVEMGWDRGEMEGLFLSLFGFGVSVRNWRPGGNHRRTEGERQQGKASCPPSTESIKPN